MAILSVGLLGKAWFFLASLLHNWFGWVIVCPRDAPLVTRIYTADPSAHVFNDVIYVYVSHDLEYDDGPFPGGGGSYKIRDYYVVSFPDGPFNGVQEYCCALGLDNVTWAKQQMWAPDAAYSNGSYYLFFPAKQYNDVFAIGVAVSDCPEGPFKANEKPIEGAYSTGHCVFEDDDGGFYLYFGGIGGGQLQQWSIENEYTGTDNYPSSFEPQIPPRIARLGSNMQELAEDACPVLIVDQCSDPVKFGDLDRRFFEALWVHKYMETYYLSYSTGSTHFVAYATSESPYGPFQYRGNILNPVWGWTTHHSVVEYQGQWFLFYHDSQLSGGVNHLRNIKMTQLEHQPDGLIQTIDPYCI